MADDYAAELGDAAVGDLLLMNGTDHQLPQPWLGRVVAEANGLQDDYHFVITSLAEYLATQPSDGLPSLEPRTCPPCRCVLIRTGEPACM